MSQPAQRHRGRLFLPSLFALALLVTVIAVAVCLSLSPPRMLEARPTYMLGQDGLFAQIHIPDRPLARPFIQDTARTLHPTTYLWESGQWKQRGFLLSWDLSLGPQAKVRLVVPNQKWKLEVRIQQQRQFKLGPFTRRLHDQTNLVVSAEFPPRSEIEAALKFSR